MFHEFYIDNVKVLIPAELDLKYLYIEVTNRCNLRCEMCFKQYWEDEEGDMDYALFLKILDDAEKFPDLRLIYFGGVGEPTVHPKFMDMVREVKKRGYAVGISTNGFLLTDERIKELVELGVDLVYISLDTLPVQPTKLGHVMPSVTVDRLKKLMRAKKEKKSEIPHVGVEVVVTKENYMQMVEIAEYLSQFDINSLLFSNIIPVNEEHSKLIVYDGSVNLEPYINQMHARGYKGFLLKLPEFELRTERHCDFIEKKVAVVRWDGEVAPCYRFLHNYPEYIFGREKKVMAYSFGNVRDKSLMEIWTSREYSWFRFLVKNAIYPSCTDCSLVDSCSFAQDTQSDCWSNSPSCGDCLWARRIVLCPVPMEMNGKFW
ncbi:aldehyde ferredoxin oxidoreductase [Palaeococcus pacificus DY20341]|uniref:Aldehyde ferredoxin oxidoreductase n=1 Tax=Palaeococcus pacificus DY20341 TaxID=1343739 RepID=A0A075LV41_9EURY|nr:tungsten cofactor oxidoreductase radical SAM maturase [Palaeococcus pacificus]AIF70184.1 aldehyde ferredoxin oxidoreductase [Palaeococcus pacificus DY20341]